MKLKSTFISLFLISFNLCLNAQQVNPEVQDIINQTNIDSLSYFVEELSGEIETTINGSPYTILSRNKWQPGNDKAADYIEEKFESYGLDVTNQSFSSTGRNVYAMQLGTQYPDEKFIICAHYDDMPSGAIAPGADDNASGTSAVLEAARLMSNYTFKYTIMYALWDEEEQGLVGSEYYADLAASNGELIAGVVNMDMIAFDSDDDGDMDIHTRNIANSMELTNTMVEVNDLYGINLNEQINNPGSTSSDHSSFWFAGSGYGAIMLIEDFGDFNTAYHTTGDQIELYNMPYYHKMAQLAFGTFASLAEIEGVVPVELLSFASEVTNQNVTLIWETATEINNNGFEIQRSANASEWVTIGFTPGNSSSTELNNYSYIDEKPLIGKSFYRLKQIDFDGTFEIFGALEVDFFGTMSFALEQNYPNPFNPSTTIQYYVPEETHISLKVFDMLGKEVATIVDEVKPGGIHQEIFDLSILNNGISSGVYFYRLATGNFIDTKKMMLAK